MFIEHTLHFSKLKHKHKALTFCKRIRNVNMKIRSMWVLNGIHKTFLVQRIWYESWLITSFNCLQSQYKGTFDRELRFNLECENEIILVKTSLWTWYSFFFSRHEINN